MAQLTRFYWSILLLAIFLHWIVISTSDSDMLNKNWSQIFMFVSKNESMNTSKYKLHAYTWISIEVYVLTCWELFKMILHTDTVWCLFGVNEVAWEVTDIQLSLKKSVEYSSFSHRDQLIRAQLLIHFHS